MALKPRLENKVAIVTGGGSRAAGIGNGRAAAILFARQGAKVLVVDNKARAGEVLGWVMSGKLRLRISQIFPLKDAPEAHRLLEGRKTAGKVLSIP